MRRDAVLRNLPESAFSTERLSRISLAAPEFVGALPRVHEEVTSQTSKSQSILPDTPSELSSGLEGELCRAALDHIARGFDHVAMVSELLQEALDTLGASHRETKQRRAVWLHAALGNAFSKAEPVSLDVEAARHLDVALKWYEDNETLMCSGIATAWAWSRAFLLEHLGQCALRLGNSSLCITVFFKLAHKDLRDYLSRPTVAIAAQRDALKLLTHGALDDRANTALLRGFSTARFGESQSQIKDSTYAAPAVQVLDQGLVDCATRIVTSEKNTAQTIVVELRIRISTPEPLHIRHLELIFRSDNAAKEDSVIVRPGELISLHGHREDSSALIPGTFYGWCGNVKVPCSTAVAETLKLVLAKNGCSILASVKPAADAQVLFEVSQAQRECIATVHLKPTATASVELSLDGSHVVFTGVPTFIRAVIMIVQSISKRVIIDISASNDVWLDVTFQLDGVRLSSSGPDLVQVIRGGVLRRYMFNICNFGNKARELGLWITCHEQTELVCKAAIDRGSLSAAEGGVTARPDGTQMEETLSDHFQKRIQVTVISPFLVEFRVINSLIRCSDFCHWNSANVDGSDERGAKMKCTIQNSQLLPVAIETITYKHAPRISSRRIFPRGVLASTVLAQEETLAIDFSTPISGRNQGYLVVRWFALNEDLIVDQSVETYILCPSTLIAQSVVSCTLDVPSRASFGHPLVATWRIKNNADYPVALRIHSVVDGAFGWAGKKQSHVELMRHETLAFNVALCPLYIGTVIVPGLNLTATQGTDQGNCSRPMTMFVLPSG